MVETRFQEYYSILVMREVDIYSFNMTYIYWGNLFKNYYYCYALSSIFYNTSYVLCKSPFRYIRVKLGQQHYTSKKMPMQLFTDFKPARGDTFMV